MNRRDALRSLFALPLVALGNADAREVEPIRDGADATIALGDGETITIQFDGAGRYEIASEV